MVGGGGDGDGGITRRLGTSRAMTVPEPQARARRSLSSAFSRSFFKRFEGGPCEPSILRLIPWISAWAFLAFASLAATCCDPARTIKKSISNKH